MTKPQAERLRQGREKAGYTQKEAATALSVAYSTYRGWESGLSEPGNLRTVVQICELFSISIDWWLTGSEQGEPNELIALTEQITPEAREAITTIAQHLAKQA